MADAFTGTVIRGALDAAAQRCFDTLRRTAMSPDHLRGAGCGHRRHRREGLLVSSGAGIPSFVGVLDRSVSAIRARHGDRIAEGDVFVTNDPNHGGVTHLCDVVLAEPVFHAGACIAWVASIAHWSDIAARPRAPCPPT